MTSFEAVKEAVTVREAAERYGIPLNRAGMTCCIFHDDHTPSMKVDDRFHCFGCGADGDVIDFTARLFDLNPKEAIEKLVADFNIFRGYDDKRRLPVSVKPVIAERSLMQRLKNYQNLNYRTLCEYLHLLEDWQKQYAPKPEDKSWHPLFLEAIHNIAKVDYLLDELQGCTAEEAKALIASCKNEIARYAGCVQEFRSKRNRGTKETAR